ncbi:MAG: LysR family transcriptional regulator, partial [Nocardia sp.]|nr:LysR family transcriptional regulator [Nocardia sp.]
MDTHRLKYFLQIAEEGSITRAARVLGVAQPALSRQVRLLEEDLGVALFRRTRRGVELTEDGERLRDAASAPLRQLELAVQYAASPLARLRRGVVLGILETAVDVVVAPLLTMLSAVFPDIGFSVTIGSTDQLVEAMHRGTVDIALINPLRDDRVFYRDLLSEELMLVGGPDSGLEADRPVPFSRLAELPLIVPRSRTGIGGILENTALRTKLTLRTRTATDSVRVATHLIAAGQAHGIMPLSACSVSVGTGALRYAPVSEPALDQRVGIAASAQLDLPR